MLRMYISSIKGKLEMSALGVLLLSISGIVLNYFFNSTTLILIILSALIAISFFTLLIARNIGLFKKDISNALQGIQKDDYSLKSTYNSENELGMAIKCINSVLESKAQLTMNKKDMANNTATLNSSLLESTHDITKSMEQVASTINDIAQGSSEQCNNIHDTVEIIQMVSQSLEEVSKDTDSMAADAKACVEMVNKSAGIMETLNENTKITVTTSDELNVAMKKTNEKSAQMNGILSVITSIATQTNLLALNAAIEAARAGEAGRGFAVVAEEIKKLSQQTTLATKTISGILSESINETGTATTRISTMNETIKGQDNLITEIGTIFNMVNINILNISNSINKLKVTLNEVNFAADDMHEQSRTILEISDNNAAAIQELSATSEEQSSALDSIYQQLNELHKMH